jgi:hypothetical protein
MSWAVRADVASIVKLGDIGLARFRDPAGKEPTRHFPRKVDAQKWIDGQTAGPVTSQWVDPRAGRLTVAEYARSGRRGSSAR